MGEAGSCVRPCACVRGGGHRERVPMRSRGGGKGKREVAWKSVAASDGERKGEREKEFQKEHTIFPNEAICQCIFNPN